MRKSENSAPRARESEWHVLQRCLALLRCILRGEATKSALLEIERAEADAIQDHDGVAFEKRLENDLHRLRVAPLNNRIVFDREHKSYSALEIDPPLIDLPPEAVKGLAFLQSAFIQDTPMYAEVRALANLVMQAIPAERRDEVTKLRGVLEIDLQRKDFDEISALIVEQIERAITNHQRLELHYAAASREDREVVIHTVEPIRRFFDTVRKHFYLEAYCLETRSSKGHFAWQEVRNYRLGRLVKVNILPKRFIPNAHRRRKIDLIYRLAPEIVRGGITPYFENTQVIMRADGSAEVHAKSSDLFFDLRTLLHYGPACEVIGGEVAVQEMKTLVDGLYQRYHKRG